MKHTVHLLRQLHWVKTLNVKTVAKLKFILIEYQLCLNIFVSLLQIKAGSREGLLQHSSDCDMEDPINVFPNKISTSTLKRGASTQRTFLLKEKRESIVWEVLKLLWSIVIYQQTHLINVIMTMFIAYWLIFTWIGVVFFLPLITSYIVCSFLKVTSQMVPFISGYYCNEVLNA